MTLQFVVSKSSYYTLTGIHKSSTNSSPSHPDNAIVNPPELFAFMRIPNFIRFLPTYGRDPFNLNEFININVEEVIQIIRGTDETPFGQMLLKQSDKKSREAAIGSGANLNSD